MSPDETSLDPIQRVNVADRLEQASAERPGDTAIIAYQHGGKFDSITFEELDDDATLLARGLVAMGVRPGMRIALLVKPSIEFVTLVFALLRSGATMVLVDAGLGRKNLVDCLASTEPEGFVGIPIAHAMRVLMRGRFPNAKLNITVGRRWFWGGETLDSLRRLGERNSPPHQGEGVQLPHTTADDPAAIVFTSGSTGPPKGVLYTHQTFVTQCGEIQQQYDLRPGAIDLACFPLFGLFNVACGITTVLPEMDFSRPASCDPHKLITTANQWNCTQAFASPAVWDKLSRHCEATGEKIPTLQKVFSCGAPVPAAVLRRTLACVHPEAKMHTPYGATESLPVATIEAKEILEETAAKTDEGAGVCVGKKFDSIDWRIIRISDDPIHSINETKELPVGEIGELIVRGPQVSQRYLLQPSPEADAPNHHNAKSKIADGATIWHRMGDVGYFDASGRFWYCGRKSQRVRHCNGDLFTGKIEPVIQSLPGVSRAALVGYGNLSDGFQEPAIVVELQSRLKSYDGARLWEDWCHIDPRLVHLWYGAGSHDTANRSFTSFPAVLVHPKLPTDIRHNSKIRREELAVWAKKEMRKRR